MTREKAIKLLDNLIGMIEDNQGSDYDTALHMGIDALLNQEPFINKLCVSGGVCEHDKQMVLDKLSAEIKNFMYHVNTSSESDYICNYILGIIDKYRAESEG